MVLMTYFDVVMIVAKICRKRHNKVTEKCWNNLEKIEEWR